MMSLIPKLARCAAILLVSTAGAQAATLLMTGILVFGGDSTGVLGAGGWNTACNPPVGQLSIAGQTACLLAVNISAPGTYTFDYSPSGGSVGDQYANLELFFNGETQMPGIHLIIDRSASNPPPISAASTTAQQCLYFNNWGPCSPNPVGPSSLSFTTGGQTVTALGFTANSSWNGQIQIQVNSGNGVPEPGTASLLAAGFAALLTCLRRKR